MRAENPVLRFSARREQVTDMATESEVQALPAPPTALPEGVRLLGVLMSRWGGEPRPEAWAKDADGRLLFATWNSAREEWNSWRPN